VGFGYKRPTDAQASLTKCPKNIVVACWAIDRQTTAAKSGGRAFASCLAARKKRQRQNRLPDLIFYDHHQSRIVIVRIVVAIFSQLSDCVLGMRKCRRYIRQVCASRVIIDPCPSAYRKEILRHSTFAHYVEDQTALPRPDGSFQSGTPKPSDSWLRREAAMISRLAGDGGGKRRAALLIHTLATVSGAFSASA
jgi:hypothetical protein